MKIWPEGKMDKATLMLRKTILVRGILVVTMLATLILPTHAQSETATPSPEYITEVYKIAWSPDGSMIAISGGLKGCDTESSIGHAVRIFDAVTGEIVKRLLGLPCPSIGVDWSPDGTQLLGVEGNTAYIWDVATEKLLQTTSFNMQGISLVKWSPNGDLFAVVSPTNTIRIWDIQANEFFELEPGGTAFAWKPDQSQVATGTSDGQEIWIQDVDDGKIVTRFKNCPCHLDSLDWSPNGKQLLTAGLDGTARVWDVSTGTILATFDVPNITDARWNSDNKIIATASLDGIIQIWNVKIGKELARFETSGRLLSVAWSPDGKQIAYFDQTNQALRILTPTLDAKNRIS
jgi:WD40 repeat protein